MVVELSPRTVHSSDLTAVKGSPSFRAGNLATVVCRVVVFHALANNGEAVTQM